MTPTTTQFPSSSHFDKILGITQCVSAVDMRDARCATEIIKHCINKMRRDFAEMGYGGSDLSTRIRSQRSTFTYDTEYDLYIQMTCLIKAI